MVLRLHLKLIVVLVSFCMFDLGTFGTFSAEIPLTRVTRIHDPLVVVDGHRLEVHINGQAKRLEVAKPGRDESVLHGNFQFIQMNGDKRDKIQYKSWKPSEDDLQRAQDVFIDAENKAVLKTRLNKHGDHIFEGVIGDQVLTHDGSYRVSDMTKPKVDYIKYELDGYYNKSTDQSSPGTGINADENIIELLIVCDKEFGDVFGHDRQKILDYWTVYMWDVNLRYRTLKKINVQFRVVGLVVAASFAAQPYIEESRGPDGKVEHGRVLSKFAGWIYQQSQAGTVPNFDMAISVSNAQQEWGGGLAYMHGACRVDNLRGANINTLSFNDGGNWGSATVGAHEMGHNVGAPHDDDSSFPDGCAERGFIMGGGNDDLRWFFSECSDREVSKFISSASADCLRRNDATPILDPNLYNPRAPNAVDQCKIATGDSSAWMEPGDEQNCKSLRCVYGCEGGSCWIRNIPPIDNTICGDGKRCLRGACRSEGYLLRNVGSGLCLVSGDQYSYSTGIIQTNCNNEGSPLDRVVMNVGGTGVTLAFPYFEGSQNGGNFETNDKCAWSGVSEDEATNLWTDRCGDYTNPWHGFDLVDVGDGQFIIKHKSTSRCLKPDTRAVGSGVASYKTCDTNSPDFRWTRSI